MAKVFLELIIFIHNSYKPLRICKRASSVKYTNHKDYLFTLLAKSRFANQYAKYYTMPHPFEIEIARFLAKEKIIITTAVK